MINVHSKEFNSVLNMFLDYVNQTELIYDYIKSIQVREIDIEKEMSKVSRSFGGEILNTGTNVEEEVAYTYNILSYINEKEISIRSFGMSYSSSKKFQDMAKGFGNRVVLPFVNHIEDYLSDIAIDMGFDEETNYMINISGGQPQVNIANDSSSISATQVNNINISELDILVGNIKTLIEKEKISKEDKEVIYDSVEVIQEELKKENPKQGFLRTAWNGIETSMEKTSKAVMLVENIEKIKTMLAPILGL